jgi:hypothetical protein
MRLLLAASCLTLAFALPALAQEDEVMAQIETVQGDSVGFGEAFDALKDAFVTGDPASGIAALGEYPFQVAANGELYDMFEPADFIDNFDALVTGETLDALASQDFADLIVTSEGVGFANGALWMANICADEACAETHWGITRINN